MNRFKLQGYVQEFPFLTEISGTIQCGNSEAIDFIKIARVDENLLAKVPNFEGQQVLW